MADLLMPALAVAGLLNTAVAAWWMDQTDTVETADWQDVARRQRADLESMYQHLESAYQRRSVGDALLHNARQVMAQVEDAALYGYSRDRLEAAVLAARQWLVSDYSLNG